MVVFRVFALPAPYGNLLDIDAAFVGAQEESFFSSALYSSGIIVRSCFESEGHGNGINGPKDGANSRLKWQSLTAAGRRTSVQRFSPLTFDTVSITHSVHPAGEPKYETIFMNIRYLLATVSLELLPETDKYHIWKVWLQELGWLLLFGLLLLTTLKNYFVIIFPV